ncbi:RICIN domain-containing protein [Streptomyces sp. NPDC059696]|uniref:RICIN domain-containing protein n=1 Tax=Streptomyces sp. NPDC059696 TaxID=3346911 RepID=UPI0036CD6676
MAREAFPGPAGSAPGAFPGSVRATPGTFSGPASEAPGTFSGPASEAPGTFPGAAPEAHEGFPGPTAGPREASRLPVETAHAAFPAQNAAPGAAHENVADPVALAGAVGESFTDPGGPAALPPFPPPAERAAPASAPTRAAAPARPRHRPEGARAAARRAAHKAARRGARRRNLTAGILTVSGLVVLPLVLWSTGDSGDNAPAGADRPAGEAPDSDAGDPTTDPSRTGTGDAQKGALRGRLHNVASDLCVGIEGEKAVRGGEAELTTCSTDAAQQWTYETDGLLRNGAAPDLCLDSRLGYSVRLAPCAGPSRPDPKNIRYDFTLQGALVPRWDQDLALAPAATDGSGALVVKARRDEDVQRWVIDTAKADLQMQAVNWNAAVPAAPATPTPSPRPTPSKTPDPAPAPTGSPVPQPTPSSPAATESPCDRYGYDCDSDGRYGTPGDGYPGYGYGGHGGGGRR